MDTTSMIARTVMLEAGPPPPDGGWGWMVVLAGFICHLVIDGFMYSSGIFFDEFLDYFREGHAATSLISSITFGCYLISSPIASGLTIRYGCRPIAIAGSLISALGLLISIYATSIKFLYFSLGLVAGTGFGLTLLPAIVCVTSYFDRRRSLATGITVCGSGVGTFVMAPLMQALIRYYGWKGALIICSGLNLQGVVAGFLMRPMASAGAAVGVPSGSDSSLTSTYEPSKLAPATRPLRPVAVYEMSSTIAKPPALGANLGTGPQATEGIMLTMVPGPRSPDSSSLQGRIRVRPDLFYERTLSEEDRQSSMAFFSVDSSLMDGAEHQSQLVTLVDNRNIVARTLFSYQMAAVLGEMLNFRLFSEPAFQAFALSRVLCGMGYSVPYLFLPSKAVAEVGVSETDASFLLSVIGFSNVVGRVAIGEAADLVGRGRIWIYTGCVMICGLSTVLSVLARTYSLLQLYAAAYGAAGGGFITLSSVVVVDLVGLDRLTNAFGLSLLCQGIATLVGPPLIGWVRDATHSFSPGFVLAGVFQYAAAVVLIAVPYLQLKEARRRSVATERDSANA
ncbi:monocarboxylate transporter 13-like [Haemaphysalis longicornis]